MGSIVGLFDWIRGGMRSAQSAVLARRVAAAVACTSHGSTAGGLDFAAAIQSHRNWKQRLARYVANESDEALDSETICCDDQCVLGRWIRGRGVADFSHLPSFAALQVSHGQFHCAAACVVRMHDEKRTQEALEELRSGDYACHSLKVAELLSSLYVEMSDTLKRVA